MRKPGQIIQLPDGRIVVKYHAQPLLKENKVVLHLLKEDFSLNTGADNKPKTLIKTIDEYNAMIPNCKGLGMVD